MSIDWPSVEEIAAELENVRDEVEPGEWREVRLQVEENGDWNIMKAAEAPELVILDREGTKCGKCGGELVCLTCANKKWREEVAIPALTRLPSRLVEIATAACWVLAGFALAAVSHQAGWFATLFGR